MQLYDLQKEKIPSSIIEIWRKRQGESLLPVQRAAVKKGLLKMSETIENESRLKRNMIITAPTSSGKSFCAELAAASALVNRQKVIMLFPLKSLAEERYRQMKESFGSLGVNMLIATSDYPENNRRFIAGDFQIAVAIYEKLDIALTINLDLLSNIGLVVIDELQMIFDPKRGTLLERLLTKITASRYTPRLIGLSAVLDDKSSARLVQWLDADLILEQVRPVDLLRGVAAEGSLKFSSFNDHSESVEPFDKLETGETSYEFVINHIKKSSGSTLLFFKSRSDTMRFAFQLASSVSWPEAKNALEKLRHEEPSSLTRSLSKVLSRGVGFHSADLTPNQRRIVEQAFVNNEIKALCSTTTLALGVNFPADTVYLETMRYKSGAYGCRPQLVPISRSEFDNMSGRAGRFLAQNRKDIKAGRSIVLAESELDREIIWEKYIKADYSSTSLSKYSSSPDDDWLLNLISAGLISKDKHIREVFARSLYNGGNVDDLALSIERLIDNNLIVREYKDRLTATETGDAVACSGLTIKEADYYRQLLNGELPSTLTGWLSLTLSSPYWEQPSSIITYAEQVGNYPLKSFYIRREALLTEISLLLEQAAHTERLPYRQSVSLKVLMLLEDWSRGDEITRLEERYQVHYGQILNLADLVAHLLVAVSSLAEADAGLRAPVKFLQEHIFSIRHGLPVELKSLYQKLGRRLQRSDYLRLLTAGISSFKDLLDLSEAGIKKIFPENCKQLIINNITETLKEEVDMLSMRTEDHRSIAVEPNSIEIVGSQEQERYLVIIDGFPVRLTGKSFKYFAKLAWSRLHSNSGWMYKEDIEVGFNQARYLYRMKNEITSGFSSGWPIVENNRLGYYRLQAKPDKIRINSDNLRRHPDWEVRKLFEEDSSIEQKVN